MYPVRNSVKAIIIRDNRLLCIRKQDENGFYFLLPGGGQEKNETMAQTLARECLEELGASVVVRKLRFIREYIAKHHEFHETDDLHQVEFMFDCDLTREPDLQLATNPDSSQVGLEWLSLDRIENYRAYPKVLLKRIKEGWPDLYWGDTN